MTPPEFSRPIPLDAIGAVPRRERIAADPVERAALARRFGLEGLDRLDAVIAVRSVEAGVRVTGTLDAALAQACSVTGDPLPVTLTDVPVDLVFVAEPAASDEEVELSADALDVVFHDGAAVDLGEAVAETMALALDPFPRGPGADAALKAAGVSGEGGPFGALAGLRDKLGGN